MACKTNINYIRDFNILGVLDGYGENGHFVSEFVSEYIVSRIINHPEIKSEFESELIYKKLKENNCKIITQAFIETNKQLNNMEFDTSESGSNCCLIIIHIGKQNKPLISWYFFLPLFSLQYYHFDLILLFFLFLLYQLMHNIQIYY